MGFVCQRCEKGIMIGNDIMSSRGSSEIAPMGDREQRLTELFENISLSAFADHPLCSDCAQVHIIELSQQYYDIITETRQYTETLEGLQSSDNLESSQDEEIVKLEKVEQELKEELDTLYEELQHTQHELDWISLQSLKVSYAEGCFDEQVVGLEYDLYKYNEVLRADMVRRGHLKEYFSDWKATGQILPYLYTIEFKGPFGTINALRLGTTNEHTVEWEELNAAWGLTASMLDNIAKRNSYTFKKFRIIPRGSFSVIERRSDKACFELFGSKEISFSTLFWFGRFDEAMVSFLYCLSEFCEFIRRKDRHFTVPFTIQGDKIGQKSIKYHKLSSNNEWTCALRLVLKTLKRVQEWESSCNKG